MSVTTIDYLPFDYITYTQRILPALHGATEGNEVPLRTLLQSLQHISFGPRSRFPLPLSAEAMEELLDGEPFDGSIGLEGLLDVATLRCARAGEALDPWQQLAKVIPILKGRSLNALGRYGEMLHFHLFYTLCTDPLAVSSTRERPVLPHDEPVFDWNCYTSRDEDMSTLWGMFERTAPEALIQYIQPQGTSYTRARALPLNVLCRECIIGFITPEETQHLLAHVRTNERPWLKSILDECIRDGEQREWEIDPTLSSDQIYQDDEEQQLAGFQAIIDYWLRVHPEEMKEIQERYYQNLWQVEAEILRRMRLAVARGWGMIQTYYS